ncbi:MAG: metallophosphoesterase family protein [Bacteroidetes bacterium]|nr:metallophosphoesterase family protein [Bacteroidota bacterium]
MKKNWKVLGMAIVLSTAAMAQSQPYPEDVQFPPGWGAPSPQPDRIILTFSGDPSRSQSVTWRTDTSVNAPKAQISLAHGAPRLRKTAIEVPVQTTVMDGRQVLTAGVKSHYHTATFTGLQPGTRYAYRVGDGTHWSEWLQFRTASAGEEPFTFLYVGDAQNYIFELWSRVIREGYRNAPDARFIIHAGDLVSDAHDERQWSEWFMAGGWLHGMLPSVPVTGNHEYRPLTAEDDKAGRRSLSVQWRHQFTLPENGPAGLEETAYTFDYQGARIIVLNSMMHQQRQRDWLDSLLRGNPNRWTIVSFHFPIYSTSGNRDNRELRELWKPLFEKYHVDLVLQGHDHTYGRGRAWSFPSNTGTGVNRRDRKAGTVYVVSVSGGKMYDFKKSGWDNYDAQLERKAENTQLFQTVHIDGKRLHYRSITAAGEPYDAFELRKRKKGREARFRERMPATPERVHDNTVPHYH